MNASETDILLSVDHVRLVEISAAKPKLAATLPTFLHVAIPRPVHTSSSVPTLAANSAWKAAVNDDYNDPKW